MSTPQPTAFAIAGRRIGPQDAPYCIAEVGINHNGELDRALRMIDAAREAGADAVKFQTFRAEEFCGDPRQTFTYQSQGKSVTESMLAMFSRYEFTAAQWRTIQAHCARAGITFFSTPQNRSDLDLLLTLGVPAIKIGSDDFTNLPLIASYAAAGLPMILSCGMADLAEVHRAIDTAGWYAGRPVALLLCTSQYPTPAKDVNLAKLATLRQAFPGLLVGFSDHTQGTLAASLAVAMGARVFEKHFTLDKGLPGPDHWFSEEPTGLAAWIDGIRTADTMMGSPFVRPTQAETDMRTLARRSVVTLRDVAEGEPLHIDNIGLRRPGNGLPPEMLASVLGMTTNRALRRGTTLSLKDLRG
ncbi:N-acetylneuraminate synthase family protein [Ideonella sp. A 288]|uniref:N-acetylneuraminate synthase family protein n=1 Tax=Ideonella sp. A 288 TaxID=1962181 RepID=UPI000B4B0D81|nr:N-acetylneuraminate synthase family protein [Ideonella sp. A 288]